MRPCFHSAGTFLGTVGGAAAIFGFSKTLMSSKQEEQKLLEKGLIEGTHVLDAGSALARRALGYGTLYAVLGCGALTYGIWKLSGASNVCVILSHHSQMRRHLYTRVCFPRWTSFDTKWVHCCPN